MAKSRLPELDILRGMAVLLVLGRHVIEIPETLPQFIRASFMLWREVGWIGVDLFFVLSGFLVSGLLFSEFRTTGRVHVSRFLIRRGFKIYPAFYFFLLVSFGTSYFFQFPNAPSLTSFVAEGVFLQNYLPGVWNHTWSLAAEEHFYFLLSFLVFILVRIRRGAKNPFLFIPQIVAGVACTLLLIRTQISFHYPAGEWARTLGFSILRIDSLFFGVFLAYLYHFDQEQLLIFIRRNVLLLMTLGIFAVGIAFMFPLTQSRVMYSGGFTILYLGFGSILLLLLFYEFKYKSRIIPHLAWLGAIGRYSYSIYLWHMMVYWISAGFCPVEASAATFYLQVVLYFAGSLAMGFLAARAIEFPILRFRDVNFPDKR